MSLYKAETRRLVKRRLTKLLVFGALGVLLAVAVAVFFSSKKIGPEQYAVAEAQAAQSFQEETEYAAQAQKDCERVQGTPEAQNYPPNCELFQPTREDYRAENYLPTTFTFRESFGPMIATLAGILALMAMVIGSSFVGAEWNTGGMTNLLLWRPQRLKVLFTKLAAFLGGLTALTVVTAAAWTGLFVLTATLRGSLETMTPGAWQSFGLTGLRALVLILVAGTLGFGLASIGRHTAVAMGVVVGFAVLLQFGLGVVLEMTEAKFAELYLIPFWLLAWLDKSYVVTDYNNCDFSVNSGSCEPNTFEITWPLSGTVMLILLTVVLAIMSWNMRRRDVT